MESCDYKVCGGDSIPFAQWSPETLGAGFVLPFALTNSGRLPSALPTGETLPSFAAAAAGSFPSFRIAKTRSTHEGHFGFLCRSGGIRTRGLLVPNQRFCRFFRLSPSASSEYRQMPVVAGFSRLFPCFSGSHSS